MNTLMENSEAKAPHSHDCNPTVHDVIEARAKTRTGVGCRPGECAICGRDLGDPYIRVGEGPLAFNMVRYYCSRAMDLADESSRVMLREEQSETSQWKRQCPALYRRIKPALRQDFPRIDWEKYDECMRWDWQAGKGLVMVGPSGSGKSTTLWHLMLRLERLNVPWSVYDGARLSDAYFKAVRANEVDALVQRLVDRPVLALEDFAKNVITEGTGAFIFDLINKRTEALKPIVMTTRFNSKTLPSRFADDPTKGYDIARRLNDYCWVQAFRMNGQSQSQREMSV